MGVAKLDQNTPNSYGPNIFFSKLLGQKTIKRVTVVDLDQNLVDQTFLTKLLDPKQPKF